MTTQPDLLRSLSLAEISLYGIGTILGAGIYVLLGNVIDVSGLMTPWAFLLAAVIVCFSAYSYAQMSRHFPRSAGEAVYVQEGLHSRALAAAAGYAIALGGIVSAATLSRGVSGYFNVIASWPAALPIILLVCLLTGAAAWGVKQSVGLAILTTGLEMAGLLLAAVVSGDELLEANIHWRELIPLPTPEYFPGIVGGAFLAFYAFIGFEDMVNMAEEVENPQRNLPLGIAIAVISTTLLYLITATVALHTLPIEDMAGSDAPLALIIERNSKIPPDIMAVIGVVAIINGALIQIIMVSRVLYGMAQQQLAPALLGRVNATSRTPLQASLLTGGLVLIFALWLPVTTLANATSSLILIVFTLVNLSLLFLNYNQGRKGPIQLGLPAIGALLCCGFLILQFWSTQ